MTFVEALNVLRDFKTDCARPRLCEAIDLVLERHADPLSQRLLTECPFCGSSKKVTKAADETFEARCGCADCNRWWGPVELKIK